ncbi:Glucan endo-1,3-beta-glucosidase, basic vacuolar isoform [Hibiscus syriacus]|uniref:glucan endo-1,3-beta-D-glucosidase n=1 Tax=Hibiscus syriacus TaxID=106335 RepID=A0A6A2YT14_HIBSY|nr:glucan endo-1,3-beta-glucosidase-like [Hibiscus syriacus]KAE8682503.1 Glucan endo-1,3-beta-glucosidase, basic vacuolar isoform [Hibiscus syriacus]
MDFPSVNRTSMVATYLILGIFIASLTIAGATKPIGVCYGRIADNLPSALDVVNFYKSNGIGKMRLYDPDQATLQALEGTNIQLILGVPNEDLQSLATPSTAAAWVQNNVLAFYPAVKIVYVAVGNEIKPNDPEAQYVLPAMQNIYNALVSAQLGSEIKVSTSVEASLLGQSYPPSAGSFGPVSSPYMTPIVMFLATTGAPLLANVYPYFGYISDPQNVRLDYALFTAPGTVVQDGSLNYQSMFDAILDAFYSALENAGGANVGIVVSETGWPSAGVEAATVENAGIYYQNVIDHVSNGTPKKPGQAIEAYLFAMFDEDLKGPAETERHFGLFSPDKQPKYNLVFS